MSMEGLKKWLQDNLRMKLLKDYEYLVDYFQSLMDDMADYIILISRRCFILYQMFAFILGWDSKNVISDRGIWRKRGALEQAVRIIIADDIMFSGNAVRRTLDKLDMYLSNGCERKIAIFCRYNGSMDTINDLPIRSYSVRTKRDCRKLTNRLVQGIQMNGIPYAVFVYPLYGFCKTDKENIFQSTRKVKNGNIFDLKEIEWSSEVYFDFIEEANILKESICDDVCLRIYRQETMGLVCVIPFAFLSNIKKECCRQFFILMQECFMNAGGELLANEIKTALAEKQNEMDGEKYTYLASVISCSLSRLIGIFYGIKDKLHIQTIEAVSEGIIRGSFSDEIVNGLNSMDAEFATKFIHELNSKKEQLKECVQKEEEGSADSRYKIIVQCQSTKKECGNILIDIFEAVREEYDNSSVASDKYISCDEITELLKEKFSEEEIHAAEIKAWDQGIATYDFIYDNLGIKSRLGIGERSQLIFSLKYQCILREFFEQLPYGSGGEYTQEQLDEDIKKILDTHSNLSDMEKKTFQKAAQLGVVNLYDYFIEI